LGKLRYKVEILSTHDVFIGKLQLVALTTFLTHDADVHHEAVWWRNG